MGSEQEMLPVEQRHRDAAAWFARQAYRDEAWAVSISQGVVDASKLVQAFARFERAHLTRPSTDAGGFVLVPRNPTKAMIEAAKEVVGSDSYILAPWLAMLSARPPAPQAQGVDRKPHHPAEPVGEEPLEPGWFVGDIFYGDPIRTTLGTHRWNGSSWEKLPTELEAVLGLLAAERQLTKRLRFDIANYEKTMRVIGELPPSKPTPAPSEREARLEAALRPFVKHWQPWMDDTSASEDGSYNYPDSGEMSCFARVTYGDLRFARAALQPDAHGEGEG